MTDDNGYDTPVSDSWVRRTGQCQVPGCGKRTNETGGVYSKDGRRWAACFSCYLRISADPTYRDRITLRQRR